MAKHTETKNPEPASRKDADVPHNLYASETVAAQAANSGYKDGTPNVYTAERVTTTTIKVTADTLQAAQNHAPIDTPLTAKDTPSPTETVTDAEVGTTKHDLERATVTTQQDSNAATISEPASETAAPQESIPETEEVTSTVEEEPTPKDAPETTSDNDIETDSYVEQPIIINVHNHIHAAGISDTQAERSAEALANAATTDTTAEDDATNHANEADAQTIPQSPNAMAPQHEATQVADTDRHNVTQGIKEQGTATPETNETVTPASNTQPTIAEIVAAQKTTDTATKEKTSPSAEKTDTKIAEPTTLDAAPATTAETTPLPASGNAATGADASQVTSTPKTNTAIEANPLNIAAEHAAPQSETLATESAPQITPRADNPSLTNRESALAAGLAATVTHYHTHHYYGNAAPNQEARTQHDAIALQERAAQRETQRDANVNNIYVTQNNASAEGLAATNGQPYASNRAYTPSVTQETPEKLVSQSHETDAQHDTDEKKQLTQQVPVQSVVPSSVNNTMAQEPLPLDTDEDMGRYGDEALKRQLEKTSERLDETTNTPANKSTETTTTTETTTEPNTKKPKPSKLARVLRTVAVVAAVAALGYFGGVFLATNVPAIGAALSGMGSAIGTGLAHLTAFGQGLGLVAINAPVNGIVLAPSAGLLGGVLGAIGATALAAKTNIISAFGTEAAVNPDMNGSEGHTLAATGQEQGHAANKDMAHNEAMQAKMGSKAAQYATKHDHYAVSRNRSNSWADKVGGSNTAERVGYRHTLQEARANDAELASLASR
jgi:hypothetical protein